MKARDSGQALNIKMGHERILFVRKFHLRVTISQRIYILFFKMNFSKWWCFYLFILFHLLFASSTLDTLKQQVWKNAKNHVFWTLSKRFSGLNLNIIHTLFSCECWDRNRESFLCQMKVSVATLHHSYRFSCVNHLFYI